MVFLRTYLHFWCHFEGGVKIHSPSHLKWQFFSQDFGDHGFVRSVQLEDIHQNSIHFRFWYPQPKATHSCCSTYMAIFFPKRAFFRKRRRHDIDPSQGDCCFHPWQPSRKPLLFPVRKGLPEKLAFHPWRRTPFWSRRRTSVSKEVIALVC